MEHYFADGVFVLVGLVIFFIGIKKGFFRMLMRSVRFLLSVAIAYFCGSLSEPIVIKWFPKVEEGVLTKAIGYAFVFVLAFVGLTVLTFLLGKLIDKGGLIHKIDALLGGTLGLLIALCVLFVAASVMRVLPVSKDLYAETTVIRFFGDSSLLEKIKFLDFGSHWSK